MKHLHNKRGIELSINFIVMLILALAMFSGGLLLVKKMFGHAEKLKGSLDAQTEKQIEKLLDSGSPVVIPLSTKEIFRNEYGTFGVGVLAQFNGKYTLEVEYQNGYQKSSKKEIPKTEVNAQEWLSGVPATQELKKNEKGKYMILVQVPKGVPSGTYIYKVTVRFHGSTDNPPLPDMPEYDNPLQMIVKVP